MIVFPNAKINIGLYVTGKRDDGFHSIESIFYPVRFTDVLEIVPSSAFSFDTEGVAIAGPQEDNLCVKAYRLMEKLYHIPPVNMFLLKNIPTGAGLGGGSADASYTLKLLNDLFELHLTVGDLMGLAAQLGSDCPFFIPNYPAYVFGRGELMEGMDVDLRGCHIIIICPGIHIPTAEAYRNIGPFTKLNIPVVHLIRRSREHWREFLGNDFERYAFSQYPVLQQIKDQLYTQGAFYASMTGSGSAIYGIFNDAIPAHITDAYRNHEGWIVWQGAV